MSTDTATAAGLDDDYRPTRWENIKWAVGNPLGGHIVTVAERIRMIGEQLTGLGPRTDEEQFRANYDWGFRMGVQRRTASTTRGEAEKLLRKCDLPTDDATMAKFGFKPTAGFTGSSTVDEIFDAGRDFERGAQR